MSTTAVVGLVASFTYLFSMVMGLLRIPEREKLYNEMKHLLEAEGFPVPPSSYYRDVIGYRRGIWGEARSLVDVFMQHGLHVSHPELLKRYRRNVAIDMIIGVFILISFFVFACSIPSLISLLHSLRR